MKNNRTPIQALIKDLEDEQLAHIKMNVSCKGIDTAINKARLFLDAEKRALISARSSSFTEGLDEQDVDLIKEYQEDAEIWFTQTFETHEK